MATQREAWQAEPAHAPAHDPSGRARGAAPYAPGAFGGAPDEEPAGHGAAGARRLDLPRSAGGALATGMVGVPAAQMLPPYLPYPGTDPTRPAAVRSPEVPRRPRRRAGTRRKPDPLLAARVTWAALRVVMGLIFLCVFADRLAGLGLPVARARTPGSTAAPRPAATSPRRRGRSPGCSTPWRAGRTRTGCS